MRVLLTEDDPTLGTSTKRALERSGYCVDWVQTGEDALLTLKANEVDLLVLDMRLPEMDGRGVVRSLRASGNSVPILIVTANDAPYQKVEGLDAGADDYLVKPFDLDELLARLRALARRREGRTNNLLQVGDVTFDPASLTVRKDDKAVSITAKELKVLSLLMRRAGQFVSKGEIESAIYDGEAEFESNTVEVAIYGLRRKLGSTFIVTARGLGYMTVP